MKSKPDYASPLMSPSEAAAVTTMSRVLLRSMANEAQFPNPRLIGKKRIAYVRKEVEAWVNARIGEVMV